MPGKVNELNFLEWGETFFKKIDFYKEVMENLEIVKDLKMKNNLKVKHFFRWSNRRRDIFFSECIIPFSVFKIIIVP